MNQYHRVITTEYAIPSKDVLRLERPFQTSSRSKITQSSKYIYSAKETKAQPQPIYSRGLIVYDKTDLDSRGEPTRKKLWVWEMKYDPTYESASSHRERKKALSYSVKDGPGEKAKDMGLVSEEDLRETEPEVENLIDFD